MAEEPNEPEGGPAHVNPDDHHMLADLWREHRTPILVVIAVLTLGLTYVLVRQNAANQATGSATNASGTPTTSGGVPTAQTSDSTTADYALSGYMQSILNALQQLGQPGGSSSGGSAPTAPVSAPRPTLPKRPSIRLTNPTGTPGRLPPTVPGGYAQPAAAQGAEQFVTVGRWTPNPAWNSTLSGIAQHEGISLTRIEQLNPQIQNPNLIYPNQSVRVA